MYRFYIGAALHCSAMREWERAERVIEAATRCTRLSDSDTRDVIRIVRERWARGWSNL